MKISKLFHYLYACIMFLPLLVIPIFAINIINRSPEPISAETESFQVIDFNQLNKTFDNQLFGNSASVIDNTLYFNSDFTATSTNVDYPYIDYGFQSVLNHVYVVRTKSNLVQTSDFRYGASGCFLYGSTLPNLTGSIRFKASISSLTHFALRIPVGQFIPQDSYFDNYVFDLTQMFGVGNEPSLDDFNNLFDDVYYPYTLSKKEIINIGTTTYNDTDIGSQFVYSLYSVTDKYFNVTDLFGFDSLQQWFILNIFNGSVNLGFYIFWNLLTYWLFASIFWLVFDVVIYVPQLVHRWLDKGVIE